MEEYPSQSFNYLIFEKLLFNNINPIEVRFTRFKYNTEPIFNTIIVCSEVNNKLLYLFSSPINDWIKKSKYQDFKIIKCLYILQHKKIDFKNLENVMITIDDKTTYYIKGVSIKENDKCLEYKKQIEEKQNEIKELNKKLENKDIKHLEYKEIIDKINLIDGYQIPLIQTKYDEEMESITRNVLNSKGIFK